MSSSSGCGSAKCALDLALAVSWTGLVSAMLLASLKQHSGLHGPCPAFNFGSSVRDDIIAQLPNVREARSTLKQA